MITLNGFLQTFTSTGTKQDETVLGDVTVQFKKDILTADLNVDTKSSVRRNLMFLEV